jgi:hypothetical protein
MHVRRALLSLGLLLACEVSPKPEAPPPAPPAPAAAEPEPPGVPATPPPPEAAVTVIREAVALLPGDVTTSLGAESEPLIDPAATFRLVLAGACKDARLLLLDASGAAVPSSASVEVGETTVLTLSPAGGLTPGSRYLLRLDGVAERNLHLGDRAYTPATYPVRAAGEAPPPPARPSKRKHQGR